MLLGGTMPQALATQFLFESQSRVSLLHSTTLHSSRRIQNHKCATSSTNVRLLNSRRHGLYCSRRLLYHRPSAATNSTETSSPTNDNELSSSWEDGWWEESENQLGPAAEVTLRMIDWPRLCKHISQFASTTVGQKACTTMRPLQSSSQKTCESIVAETRAADVIEAEFGADIDFGGIMSAQAETALSRASKGGMLSGTALQSIASLLLGAAKLQRTIKTAAREAEGGRAFTVLMPIIAPFKDIATFPGLAADIGFAIDDDGNIRENASDAVKKAKSRIRTLENRLRSLLKGHHGEVTEHGSRLCVAISSSKDSSSSSKGILLGSSPGGSTWYIEPPAAVPMNNDLAAARGELAAAEDTVLWALTHKVSEVAYDLKGTLKTVTWLDVAVAKARYGRWVNGTLPRFVPFPKTGRARGGSAKNAAAVENGEEDPNDDIKGLFVSLRRLRHPLLLGEYLLGKQHADKERRKSSGGLNGGIKRATNNTKAYNSSSDSEAESDSESSTKKSSPIVAVDMVISPTTRAVVVTGPNTGGKTAGMKALALSVCMAKCGVPIPCAEPAVLPCFDTVLADIGDEQSLSANLSTFSGHLKRIEALRRESTGKSLVVLDELGTGTDPVEGSALGIALLERMSQGGPGGAGLVIATTHHSALTSLKYDYADDKNNSNKFENASVEFDDVVLAPTYRLLWGIPGRSNALNIAERLGMDIDVVEDARKRLGQGVEEVNSTIMELEELQRRVDTDGVIVEEAERELARTRAQIREKR